MPSYQDNSYYCNTWTFQSPCVLFPHTCACLIAYACDVQGVDAHVRRDVRSRADLTPSRYGNFRGGDLPATHKQLSYLRSLVLDSGGDWATYERPTTKQEADKAIKSFLGRAQ